MMKRIIKCAILCLIVVAIGVFLETDANSEREKSKQKKPTKHIEKEADDRTEKLQEAFEVDNGNDILVDDIDKDVEDQTFTSLRYAAYTDDGFYVYDVSSNLLLFVDKKTCKMVPLCSKPDCAHNYVDCDAFYYTFNAIFAYDGSIYLVAGDDSTSTMCLYRINRDGSERTLVKTLFAVESDSAYSFIFSLHKGCLYMTVDNLAEDFYTENDSYLYCYSLDSKNKKEILKHTGYSASIKVVNCDGDNLYLRVYEHDKSGIEVGEVYKYYCYNVKDETMTELNVPEGYYVCYCKDGRIIADYSIAEPPEYSISKYELHQLNIDGKKDKVVYSDENFMFNHSCTDSKYQYMIINKDEKRYLIVVSHDGKEVYRTDAKDYSMMVWSDKKDILLKSETSGKYALCNIKTGKIEEVCMR